MGKCRKDPNQRPSTTKVAEGRKDGRKKETPGQKTGLVVENPGALVESAMKKGVEQKRRRGPLLYPLCCRIKGWACGAVVNEKPRAEDT